MWKWIKYSLKKIIIFGIVGMIVIPGLINALFKLDLGIELFRAEWDAGDALSFYGMLLAAILAVCGVCMTIDYSNRNYRDDLRNKVLPFFSVYNLKTKLKRDWLALDNDEEVTSNTSSIKGYQEYKIEDYCFVLEDGVINLFDGLSNKQKKLLDNGGFKWIVVDGVAMFVATHHICKPMEIENVGNGTALSFRIGFNRKDCPKKERKFAYAIPIKVGERIMVHIFSEDCGKDSASLGDYVLEMYYKDIYGNEYSQKHDINIDYSDEHNSPVIKIVNEEKQNLEKLSLWE